MPRRSHASLALLLTLGVAVPASGQAPQFRADVRQTGDTPFTGTMYVGATKVRIEGTANGEQMTMIIDSDAGTVTMIMPDQRAYMTMDAGSMPFTAPGSGTMDPANPCSSGEVTECESLGTQTINGHSARGWEYTRDGERETGWIATDLRFPVRMIDGDGNQSDFTNITMGPQPASLFEPPAGYTAMDMGGMFGGRGRGAAARGGPPPGAGGRGRGAGGAPPPSGIPPGALPPGVDPAQLAALGLDPAMIAQVSAIGTATNSAPWEQGDGWVVDITGTASDTETERFENGGSYTERYSISFTVSVPIPYGTPAVGAAIGPAWQLVPTLGSPRGLAQPLTISWTSEYRSDLVNPPGCPTDDGMRRVVEGRGTGTLTTSDHNSVEMATAGQARFEISGDLGSYNLMAGGAAPGTQTMTTTTTTQGACGSPPTSETETDTREVDNGGLVQVTAQPLPASPGPMSGTTTVPMRFAIGNFSGELPTNVQWTLRPIS